MNEKKFIGRCKPGKFENQVDVGIKREDLEFLLNNLNADGWVNLRLNKGKDSGKPYIEFVQPKTTF